MALAERQEAAWRLQHAYRARLHDSGVWRSDDLDDIEERREAAQARLQEVSPDLVRAKERQEKEQAWWREQETIRQAE